MIKALQFKTLFSGGNTNTGRALSFGLYNVMSPSNGARPYIPKAALVLTDGRSQDSVGNPARELRQAGVKVRKILYFVTGIKGQLGQTPSFTKV